MRADYILMGAYLVLLSGYFLLEYLAYVKASNKLVGYTAVSPEYSILIKLNLAGIFLFGVLPFIISKKLTALYLLPLQMPSISVVFTIFLFSGIAFTISFMGAQQKIIHNKFYAGKPLRTELSMLILPGGLTKRMSVLYFSIRLVYLFCYEYFFRGLLLFNTSVLTGWPVAIAINVFFYSFSHILSSKAETIGTIPFGIAVCYVCFLSQSFLPAFVLHLVLSFTYEGLLLTYHFIHLKKLPS